MLGGFGGMRDPMGTVSAPGCEDGGAGPVLQILQPHHHVHLRAEPTRVGHQAVGAWSSTHPHTSANASAARSPGGAVVIAGQRLGLRVEQRGNRLEHGRVVEPPLDPPTTARRLRVINTSFTPGGGPSSGGSPS